MDNPFVFDRPLSSPDRLVGRSAALGRVAARLLDPALESSWVVAGPGMGKTSLLLALVHPATLRAHGLTPADLVFVYLDPRAAPPAGPADFWRGFLLSLRRRLPEPATQAALGALLAAGRWDPWQLLDLVDDLPRRVVLLLDNVDVLLAGGRFDRPFFDLWRALVTRRRLALVAAGTCGPARAFSLAGVVPAIHLPPFSPADLSALLDTYLAGAGVTLLPPEKLFLDWIAGRHPRLTQLAAHHLVAAQQQGLDLPARLRAALPAVWRRGLADLVAGWQVARPEEKMLLALLALSDPAGGVVAGAGGWVRYYRRADLVLRRLLDRGLALAAPAGLRLASPLLARWIVAELGGPTISPACRPLVAGWLARPETDPSAAAFLESLLNTAQTGKKK